MKRFRLEENGYNREDVEKYLSTIIPKIDNLIEINKLQRDEINSLEKKVLKYQSLLSNHTTDDDLIIKEAKEYASRIINDALVRASKVDK